MTVLLAAEYSDAVPWGVVAGIALGAWFVLFFLVSAATMPTLPDAGPETTELGPEPPAVVNLLVNRCKVTTSAASATLVDLAARGRLSLELIGGGEHLVRLRGGQGDETNAYEKQLLDLVRRRASDGTVPASELSLGYGDEAQKWWKTFERAVIDHAYRLGLVRPRFARAQTLLLAGTLAVPAAFAAVALEIYGTAERAAGNDMDSGSGVGIAAFLWVVALFVGTKVLRSWRETPEGDAAAARWLGVGNFLQRSQSFQEAPPSGVVMWSKLLSYGVALGAAHGTDAALPIGPTRDDEGWSPYRGLWRQLRIRYPKGFGYGAKPRNAALIAAAVLGGAVLSVVVFHDLIGAAFDLAGDAFGDDSAGVRLIAILLSVLFFAPVVFLGACVVRALLLLQRALSDFGQVQTFEGYVVRVPWHYVKDSNREGRWVPRGYTAVDDGRSDHEIEALRYYDENVKEGQIVRVTMTPRIRHVVHMEPVTAQPERT